MQKSPSKHIFAYVGIHSGDFRMEEAGASGEMRRIKEIIVYELFIVL